MRSAETAQERLFEPDTARSSAGRLPEGLRAGLESRVWNRLSTFL